ncbi:MAG: PEGA domain-containing protein [Deltaproteobacteria bacterium]|nr:PEGA domain-containing protein [Deltaproteobacteria bacterium]
MKKLLVPVIGLSAVILLAGCFPKGQIYGVGNEGGLIFAVNPPDAEVLLDGVIQGKASEFTEERFLKVPAGTHVLELRLAGFETHRREVYVSNSLLRIEAALIHAGPGVGGR